MSKLNVGVGEEFPLDDQQHERAPWLRPRRHHRRHGHGTRAVGALIILPAAASVTAAILYPLVTLGVLGGVGLVAAAHRHGRWQRYRDAYRRHYAEQQDKPRDTPPPPQDPKESA
jgi:hypothetical protein